MINPHDTHEPPVDDQQALDQPPRDKGLSLVELLATIVILGVVAGSVLTALSTSINASSRQREMASAIAWLQSANAVLEIMGKQTCLEDASEVAPIYEEQLREEAINNGGWAPEQLSVEQVLFWNGEGFDDECSAEVQKLTLRVTSPSGRVTQRLDVIVDDPYAELERSTVPGSDPPSTCAVASITMLDKKGNAAPFPLKKPSEKKESELKDRPVKVTLTVDGVCRGKVELRYLWPHHCHAEAKKPEKCHYHMRKVKMKLVKGTSDTYTGDIKKKDKWVPSQTATVYVVEHRSKSKRWTPIINGELIDALRFQS